MWMARAATSQTFISWAMSSSASSKHFAAIAENGSELELVAERRTFRIGHGMSACPE